MANGFRELVFNTQERLISADMNRATRFLRQDIAELLRLSYDANGNDDLDAGAVLAEPNSVETPLRAEIVGGFLVRPTNGSFGLEVDPGIMLAMAPDGSPDESSYKYLRRDTIITGLAVTANASGFARIDLVELEIGPAAEVSDNRDVFNTSTGLFTATSLVKETKGTVVASVRAGTGGTGMPARQAGKLPIAVVYVPNGATSNDDCTFWDVRPLLSDREFQPFASSSALPAPPRIVGDVAVTTAASDVRFAAKIDAILSGRRVGGRLRRGTPGTDADYVNVADAANGEGAGVSWSASTHIYFLYLMTPFGLPRWARYTAASAGARTPRSPRGIPVMSLTGPDHLSGAPSTPIVLPDSLGFNGATSSEGVCVWSSQGRTNAKGYAAIADGRMQTIGDNGQTLTINGTNASGLVSFLGTENTHWPAHARAIYVRLIATITIAGETAEEVPTQLTVYKAATATGDSFVHNGAVRHIYNPAVGSANFQIRSEIIRIPLQANYPNATGFAASSRLFDWQTLHSGSFSGTPTMRILGWDL